MTECCKVQFPSLNYALNYITDCSFVCARMRVRVCIDAYECAVVYVHAEVCGCQRKAK